MATTMYKNNITQMYELAREHNLSVLVHESPMDTKTRTFLVTVEVGNLKAWGRGHSKKEAKDRAAMYVLKPLKNLPLPQNQQGKTQGKKANTTPSLEQVSYAVNEQGQAILFKEGMDPCSCLSELVEARRLKYPEYSLVEAKRLPWGWLFSMRVTVGTFHTVETGPTKKAAKRNAAAKMLELLGVAPPTYNPLFKLQQVPPTCGKELDMEDVELLPPRALPVQTEMLNEDVTVPKTLASEVLPLQTTPEPNPEPAQDKKESATGSKTQATIKTEFSEADIILDTFGPFDFNEPEVFSQKPTLCEADSVREEILLQNETNEMQDIPSPQVDLIGREDSVDLQDIQLDTEEEDMVTIQLKPENLVHILETEVLILKTENQNPGTGTDKETTVRVENSNPDIILETFGPNYLIEPQVFSPQETLCEVESEEILLQNETNEMQDIPSPQVDLLGRGDSEDLQDIQLDTEEADTVTIQLKPENLVHILETEVLILKTENQNPGTGTDKETVVRVENSNPDIIHDTFGPNYLIEPQVFSLQETLCEVEGEEILLQNETNEMQDIMQDSVDQKNIQLDAKEPGIPILQLKPENLVQILEYEVHIPEAEDQISETKVQSLETCPSLNKEMVSQDKITSAPEISSDMDKDPAADTAGQRDGHAVNNGRKKKRSRLRRFFETVARFFTKSHR